VNDLVKSFQIIGRRNSSELPSAHTDIPSSVMGSQNERKQKKDVFEMPGGESDK
jgi:hypothetical protein